MSKKYVVRTGVTIPDLDLGGIQTGYEISAPNESDAKRDAKERFKSEFPMLSKKYQIHTYILK